ncbi:uncharacterized protein LOC142167048 [Nicotiana tabacum]|uniref:Uncharacterized protein LOC142167048 n=1 Tax=Nicotiana tabacum TaxID=4097 RepID=A0AC58SEA5_TOBAC
MGDFIAVLIVDDRINGNPIHETEVTDFRKFMRTCNMTEIKNVGREHTWTNKSIHSKIDRGVVNNEWMNQFSHLDMVVMEPYFSDHSPLCITIEENLEKGPKPFRFFNYMADHKKFAMKVEEGWYKTGQGKLMEHIWAKLKMIKFEMKQLAVSYFQGIGKNVETIRHKLLAVQDHMRILNYIAKQKSRNQWLQLGDDNTAYFFASIKNRVAQNKSRSPVTNSGELIQSEKAITEEIIGFYKQLLGSAATQLPAINPRVMQDGKCLTRDMQKQLILLVTRKEIIDALNDIDDQNAPGCDGFNALFYKRAWKII